MNPSQKCPECGAPWRTGETCEAYFHTLLFWETEQPALGEVHHLMVLCYHLQHPSLYSPEGLQHAQELLVQFIDQSLTSQQVRQRNRTHLDSRQRDWKITATSAAQGAYAVLPNWTLTIADLVAAGPEAYRVNVRRWAEETRKAMH